MWGSRRDRPERARASFRTRASRLAVIFWIIVGVMLWNVIFDREIVSASRDYVRRQTSYQSGEGPYVRMDDVMGQAAARGLAKASLWALVVTGSGLALTHATFRRDRAKRN